MVCLWEIGWNVLPGIRSHRCRGLGGFQGLPGCRPNEPRATYGGHDLDEQPDVPRQEDLSWLEGGRSEQLQWSIAGEDAAAPVRPLTAAGLEAVTAELPVPPSLRLLAERPELQRRIRSATARYLDLGDFATATTVEGGRLIHVLSDQQWIRHWLLYLDAAGGEAVLTTTEPIGFKLPDDWPPPPSVIPIGNGEIDLEVCADSFAEFLYRFWIENEIFFAHRQSRALSPPAAAYAAHFRRTGMRHIRCRRGRGADGGDRRAGDPGLADLQHRSAGAPAPRQLRRWIAAGASIAGGCCRVRPADIAVIARAAADAGQAPAD